VKLLIFLDELYFRRADGSYWSPSNAGRFLLGLVERHDLVFAVPTAHALREGGRAATLIPPTTPVVPLPEWRSLAGYARRYWTYNREVESQLLSTIRSVDAVWLRLPSLAGLGVARLAEEYCVPLLLHIAGDVRYAYKAAKYKGLIRPIAAFAGFYIHQRMKLLACRPGRHVLCTGQALLDTFRQQNAYLFLDSEVEPDDSVPQRVRARRFLFVGRLLESKGILVLLDAWRQVRGDLELHVVGYGEREGEMVRCATADPRIHYHGFLHGEALAEVYRRCDILLMPTTTYPEGFPRVIGEAWAFGLAVISSNVGGIRGIGKDRENIWFVRPGSVEDLTRAVTELSRNEELYRALSRNGYKTSAELSNGRMIALVDAILEQIKRDSSGR